MSENLIWISGATQGIGLGLARQAPYADAKIINLSRRPHPDYESVFLDLGEPATWDAVIDDFNSRLADFRGRRAIFIHNAIVPNEFGRVGELDPAAYRRSLLGNCAGALVLADAFIRACQDGYEAGLVLLSSDSAAMPLPGLATYCASKVAFEHWCEVVRRERILAGRGPWVVAVRPGGVITPPVARMADLSDEVYPGASRVREGLADRVDIDEAGRRIWAALPPPPGVSTISFGKAPTDDRRYDGPHLKMMFS